jgi:hypothetical protein
VAAIDPVNIAYTIGRTSSYDEALATEPKVTKTGRRDDYSGGWVWKTQQEAEAFRHTPEFRAAFPQARPDEFSCYVLELPEPWERAVSQVPGADGVHNILVDARILRKA